MLTEIVTKPVRAVVALVELPLTARRSLEEVNELMEVSRRQLEAMQRQTDAALDQAERMNELLGRVVKLTEPIEKAQRGGEYVAGGLRRVIFGDGPSAPSPPADAGAVSGPGTEERIERAVTEAELAAAEAERAAIEAENAVEATEAPETGASEDADPPGGPAPR